MRQLTPQSWGRVYWSGGAGKPGEMGGWRFHCNWCTEGSLHTAFARKHLADEYLSNHCMEKHRHKTEVRALIQHVPMHDGPDTYATWKITTEAAEMGGLIDGREAANVKLTPIEDHSQFSTPIDHHCIARTADPLTLQNTTGAAEVEAPSVAQAWHETTIQENM